MQRFLVSCDRLEFPAFCPDRFFEMLTQLLILDSEWIPSDKGKSLYIRPTAISMSDTLGVKRADKIKMFVIMSPVGNYFSDQIKLAICENYQQGSAKGPNAYKLGANYGPTVKITNDLKKQGYNQTLWLHNGYITESGATNIFFLYTDASNG
jgi:branched-chain amino acid aminotransferase